MFNVWSYEDYLKQLAAHQDETANDIEADDGISQPWDHPVLPEDRYEIIIDETITEHDEPVAPPVVIPATARAEAEHASVIAQENNKPVTQEPVVEGRTINTVTQEPVDNEEGSGFSTQNEGSGSSPPLSVDSVSIMTPSDVTQTVESIDSFTPEDSTQVAADETTTLVPNEGELQESTLTTLVATDDAIVSTTIQPSNDAAENPTESTTDDATDLTTIAVSLLTVKKMNSIYNELIAFRWRKRARLDGPTARMKQQFCQ